jgi:hypothetical protein
MKFTKHFSAHEILEVKGNVAILVEAWLREKGLKIPISCDFEPIAIEARIKNALNAANWIVFSWTDPSTDEFVVNATIPK